MKRFQKGLGLLLVCSMLLSLVPVPAWAAGESSGTCGDNLTWTLVDGTLTISGNGDMGEKNTTFYAPWDDVREEIRAVVVESGVTSVNSYAFAACDNLETAVIPDSVTEISGWAFNGCENLSQVSLPATAVLGVNAFAKCTGVRTVKLTGTGDMVYYRALAGGNHIPWGVSTQEVTVELADGVTSISVGAFRSCGALSEIVIPDSVSLIGEEAFYESGLKRVAIPDSVAEIGKYAFFGCKSLEEISLPVNLEWPTGCFTGCTAIKNVKLTGEGAMPLRASNSTPWSVGSEAGNQVTVEVGNGITELYGFSGCTGLTKVVLPPSAVIGMDEFSGCTGLEQITIPEGVESIGSNAFRNCKSLRSIELPDSVTEVGDGAFQGCSSLESVPLPHGLKKISYRLFSGCTSLSEMRIPDGVTAINGYAFQGCTALERIVVPGSVTYISNDVFEGCARLQSAGPIGGDDNFQFGWTETIPKDAFAGCPGLTSVTIPDGITTIGSKAFADCQALHSITLPDSITSIGSSIFENNNSVRDLYYAGSEAQWESIDIGIPNPQLETVTIHYNSAVPGQPGDNGRSKVLLLLEDEETGELCFENPLDRIPDSLDKEALKDLVGTFVWVTYTTAAQTEIENIQALESHFDTIQAISEDSITVDEQSYPHTVALPFLEELEGKEVVYHVLDGTVVDIQLPVKGSGKLNTWEAETAQVGIGAQTYYTNELTDLSFVDHLAQLQGWDVEYLHVGNVVLRIAAVLDSETEGTKRFQRYDESTNTVYFADNTSYPVEKDAALDFAGLENRWVRYTLRYTEEGPQLTSIQKVEPTVRVEVLLDGRSIEYQGGKLRFEGGEFEDKASFEIPVTVKVTNSTAISGVGQSELQGDSTLAVTLEQVEVTAPEGFNFGWFGGGSIKLDSPVTLRAGDVWDSDQDGKTGYIRLGTFDKPTEATHQYPVTAVVQTSIGTQQGAQSFAIINLDYDTGGEPEPEEPGDTETLTYWEREFLGELYKAEDIDVTADNSFFSLSEYFNQSTIEDIGRLAVYWSAVLRSDAAKNTKGELPAYLKITCTMTEGRYRGREATLIFHYRSYLNWYFATMEEISFVLIDNQSKRVLIEPQLHSFSVSASARDFADGIQGYLQVKFGEDLKKFCEKLGTKAIKDMVKEMATMTGEEYINTLLSLMEDIDKIAKNAKDFTDYAGKASAILRNPIKASVSSADEFNSIGAKLVDVQCPVDVYVYNPAGELCGAVENGVVVVDTMETFLSVSGGEKRVWLNDDYTLKLVATGEGTMNYTIAEYSGSTNTRTVYFEDVPLKTGLVYEGAVPADKDVPSAEYALTSNEGTVVYADRDTKTQSYTVTFDPNGGTISETSRTMKTGTDGRLAALPANPTRSGYTFYGWYTAASGGTKIDTGYVFRADTTVYAHWSVNTTGSTSYSISIRKTSHGYVSSNYYQAEQGDMVVLRIYPDSGYELDSLWVTNVWGNEVPLTERDIDRYTFSMPASQVQIDANFTRRNTWTPSIEPSTPSRPTNDTETTVLNIPSPNAYGQVFSDVPTGHWAAGTIAWAYQNGYMNGIGGGKFDPEGTMTNQQLWMVISRLMSCPAENLEQAGGWAINLGLANGRAPTGLLTRQEMVNDLYRTAFLMGGSVSRQGSLDQYPDGLQLRGNAREVMAWAVASGIITGTGDGRLNPGHTVTRAQFATILYRFHYTSL